jgi:hypothetical protein
VKNEEGMVLFGKEVTADNIHLLAKRVQEQSKKVVEEAEISVRRQRSSSSQAPGRK